jgi:hypothetical protein
MAADPNMTIWVEWERLLVDERGFAGHGTIHSIMSGAAASQRELEIYDPDARYDVIGGLTVFGDMANGLLEREVLFMDPSIRRAGKGDSLPTAQQFRNRLGTTASAVG